ncbi:MAG TPA: response regulator, partial [Helicobacteraceae bacterium]|nr:response regulator [Helicobacteraceae bacterium]
KQEQLLDELDSKFKEKSLKVIFSSENTKNMLICDWLRISQIFINILGNAIKFTDDGGIISFDVRYEEGTLHTTISDNGIGMDNETLERIFDSFEQADMSTTRQYGGTGLGLSITKQLVSLMKGSIHATSQKDEGTTFEIAIPLRQDNNCTVKNEANETTESTPLQFSGNILVAEDNKTNQLLITMMLDEYGLACDIANDGVEAVRMCQEKEYDLILMDENMPNMNGIGALHEIRKLGYALPVVALTANVMKGDEARFLAEGMDAFVPKPIDAKQLEAVLSQYLT